MVGFELRDRVVGVCYRCTLDIMSLMPYLVGLRVLKEVCKVSYLVCHIGLYFLHRRLFFDMNVINSVISPDRF